MSPFALTWAALAVLFVLGAAPVLVVRLAALLYPKGHPRRAELVAEMQHVAGLRHALARWYWMSETVALALCEGTAARFSRTAGLPIAYLIRRTGKVTITVWRDADKRLHFDFEQEPSEDLLLERARPEHAAEIAELDRQQKVSRRAQRRSRWTPVRVRILAQVSLMRMRAKWRMPAAGSRPGPRGRSRAGRSTT